VASAQKPQSGTYTYNIAFAEANGKSLGATCIVVIKGDKIKIVHNGKSNLTGQKGSIIDQGIIMKHVRTGKWIIGHNTRDRYAKEIGGCSEGPSIIDFRQKKFWMC
jgi:hypothetical protein